MLCKVIASEGDAKFIPHINERVFFGGVDKNSKNVEAVL